MLEICVQDPSKNESGLVFNEKNSNSFNLY